MKIAEFRTEGHYQAILPEKSLSKFIQFYYIFNLDKVPNHERRELIQPTLFPKVIYKFGGDYENYNVQSKTTETFNSSIISGIQLDAIASKRCNTNEQLLVIGIEFHPIGFYRILNMPQSEIVNKRIKIADLSCELLSIIEEELASAKSNQEIITILNKNFTAYFQNYSLDRECKSIYKFMSLQSSKNLYDQKHHISSSYKSLERKFKKYIGITPVKYYKQKRFLNFYQEWLDIDPTNYTELVFKNGFYDQNHLIKEFKSILGQSPNKFKKSKYEYYTEKILEANLNKL